MARAYAGVTPLDQRYSAAYDSKEVTRSDIWDQRFKQVERRLPRVTERHLPRVTERRLPRVTERHLPLACSATGGQGKRAGLPRAPPHDAPGLRRYSSRASFPARCVQVQAVERAGGVH